MNRQEKAAVVDQLRNNLQKSKAVYVISYQKLPVALLQSLRRELRKHDGFFKVAKARLMRKAADGFAGAAQLDPYFKQQIGLVFAEGEASSAVAKVLYNFAQENAALKLIVGCLDPATE